MKKKLLLLALVLSSATILSACAKRKDMNEPSVRNDQTTQSLEKETQELDQETQKDPLAEEEMTSPSPMSSATDVSSLEKDLNDTKLEEETFQ